MEKPWVSGPAELLKHGLEHLEGGSDFDRRLGLIAVDNAVEVAIRAFLSLPKRAAGSPKLSRAQRAKIGDTFPDLLDALEEHAPDRLSGVELDDIEFYHRLRNDLYHGGSGLTVESRQVDLYADLARVLFKNLFDYEIRGLKAPDSDARFLFAWAALERMLNDRAIVDERHRNMHLNASIIARVLAGTGAISEALAERVISLNDIRRHLVHQAALPAGADMGQATSEALALYSEFRTMLDSGDLVAAVVTAPEPATELAPS